jgi:hypothetical protein
MKNGGFSPSSRIKSFFAKYELFPKAELVGKI